MQNRIKNYIDSILSNGLHKDYWFMTKQTMTDFFFILTIAKIVKEYPLKKKINENFGSFYSRFFSEDQYLKTSYPKQSESENTYRNAIISEFFGLFYREKNGYDSGIVTPAFEVLNKYISTHNDVDKYRFLIDRQIEKLGLNINEKIQNYSDLENVKVFPVMLLYKILYELYKKTGDSKLYYDEFVVYLFRAKKYSDWENIIEMILAHRNEGLTSEYEIKYKQICSDVTAQNIRFDTLFGTLTNIEYVTRVSRNYYYIRNTNEALRYIENAIEIFESSKYSKDDVTKNDMITLLRSDKYFIGNLDVMFIGENNIIDMLEDDKMDLNIDESSRLTGGTNVILYGVPGAGKSWTIEHEYMDNNTKMERLVFHPDYTYSDFVGQILPKKKGDDISYDFIPGPFTKIMREAYHNPNKKFILAIEEINRGNAPAIFGDIFQLLDRDKNGASSYKIMNSDIAREMYGDENHEVSIPSNLTLLCTMNTSDQNVFTLDTAFQRRWNMRLIENSFRKDTQEEKDFAAKTILDTSVKWEAFCVAINNQILEKNQNMTSSEDKRLGTHFVSLDDLTMRDENSIADGKENKLKNRRFPEKVIKYLWDDAFKFYRDEIFKGELNSLEKVISVFTTKTKDDRFDIFKDNIRSAIFDENKK